VSAVLLTRLKIVDLAAWTALDAGRRLLPEGHTLDKVVREELYLFEPEEGSAAGAFENALLGAIESSNFFVNPNKEHYRFLTAAARGETLGAPQGAWGILTRARDDSRDDELRTRLQREHPLRGLGAIRRGRIWWLWTAGPGGGAAAETGYRFLGRVTGRDQGLLVNPHAEADLSMMNATSWRDIESFLTRPAPSLEAAAARRSA
jgi:hypothetical protein